MRTVHVYLTLTLLAAGLIPVAVCAGEDFDTASAVNWVQEHGTDPTQYLADKFKDHDLVLLGEEHRVRQFTQFVANSIPSLYEQGVTVLAMEFEYSINQPLIDSFLALPWLDNELLYRIRRRPADDPLATYMEYIDILRVCWKFNRTLPPESTPIKLLALDLTSDEPEYKEGEGAYARDAHMFGVLEREVISQGKKALVYCGWMHAMSRLVPPKVIDGRPSATEHRVRLGNHLRYRCGDRLFSVFFYAPHFFTPDNLIAEPTTVISLDGLIESVMARLSDKPVGFDVAPSPFGPLSSAGTFFRFMKPDWTMADISDGMLYLCPVKDWRPVAIENIFLNDSVFQSLGVADFEKLTLNEYLRVKLEDVENTVRAIKAESYEHLERADK